MGFWTLLEVASMPMLQVLMVTALGAFMATDYLNLLPEGARKSLNKVVYANQHRVSLFVGGIIGWAAAKMLNLKPHLEGLFIATCSSGNLGNILLILVPAICKEGGSPFGDHSVCVFEGLSYSSFSMALGGIYIWTYTYQLIRSLTLKYKALKAAEEDIKEPNKDLDVNEKTHLLTVESQEHVSIVVLSMKSSEKDTGNQPVSSSIQILLVGSSSHHFDSNTGVKFGIKRALVK